MTPLAPLVSPRFLLPLAFLAAACGSDSDPDSDAAGSTVFDASSQTVIDAAPGTPDAQASAADAQPTSPDASAKRTNLLPQFCPSTVTPPGFYEGSLSLNLNDIGSCGVLSAPGLDGSVRLELTPGQTVSATMRHDGDGILYILDRCPVTSSCLDSSDSTISGAESVSYTNNTGETNTVYVVLDSDDLGGPQTFELDLFVD